MRRRVAAVALVAAVVLAGLAGTATAAAPYDDPGQVCQGENHRVRVLLADGTVLQSGQQLFVGTSARVVYCSASSGGNAAAPTSAWGLTSMDGVTVTEEADRWVGIRATAPTAVDLAAHVENKSADRTDAPTLEVVAAGGVDVDYLGNVSTIQFRSDATSAAFADARSGYLSAVNDTDTLTERLRSAADAGSPAGALDASVLRSVAERETTLEEQSAAVERVLASAATNGAGHAGEAFFAQRAHADAAATDLESAADAYVAAVEAQASSARLTFTGLLVGPLLVGVLAGAFAGRWVSRRDLKQVRQRRRRDRTVDYSLTNLWKVLFGAALLFVAGLAVLLVGTGVGRFLQVML